MKLALKILLAIIATPIVLFALLVALLYCPPVQQWAVQRAANYASEATGMKVSIQSVRLSWPLDLDLRGLQALQPNDSVKAANASAKNATDTVAQVQSLVCSVQLRPLFDGKVNIDRLDFNGLKVNTLQLIPSVTIKGHVGRLCVTSHGVDLPKSHVIVDGGTLARAQLDIALSDSVPEDTTESENFWQVDIRRLNIQQTELALHTAGDTMAVRARMADATVRNAYLGLHDNIYKVAALDWHGGFLQYDQNYAARAQSGLDTGHLLLQQLNLGIDSLCYTAPRTSLSIRACNFTEQSGLRIDGLTARFDMDSTQLAVGGLRLLMPHTDLNGQVAMDMNAFDDIHPGQLNLLLKGHTAVADYKPFLTALPKNIAAILPQNRINIDAELAGNMQQAKIKKLDFGIVDILSLSANGNIINPMDMNKLAASVRLKGELKNLAFIKPLLPQSVTSAVALPHNIGFCYDLTARHGRYSLHGMTTQGGGALQTDGYYDTRSDAYELAATVKQFPLNHFLPKQGLSPFTGSLGVAGRGTDILGGRAAVALKADVKQLSYQTYNLDDIKLRATLSGSKLDARIDSRNKLAAGQLTAYGTVSEKAVDVYLKGNISHTDLHRLAALEQHYTLATGLDIHLATDLQRQYALSGTFSGLDLRERGDSVISGTATIDVQTDLRQYYDVTGQVADLTLNDHGTAYNIGDLDLSLLSRADTTHAMVSGGDFLLDASAHGGYQTAIDAFSRIADYITRQLEKKEIDHVALRQLLPTAQLSLHTGQENALCRIIQRQGLAFRQADIELESSVLKGLNGTAVLDSVVYNDSITIDHATLDLRTIGDSLTYALAVENQETNDYPYRAYLAGQLLTNGVQAQATVLDKEGKTGLDLALEARMKGSGINLAITSPQSILGYKQFAVNDDNYIYVGQDQRVSARMRLKADDGAGVQLLSNDEDSTSLQNLTLSMNNFELEKVFTVLPMMPRMSGVLNGDYHVIQTADELTVSSDMTIDRMTYEDCLMGDIGTSLVYMPKGDGTHFVDAIITKDGQDVGQLTGTYDPAGQGVLDADFKLDQFPLQFVNGFIPDKIIGLRGNGDGTLSVKGPLDKLDINGEVYLADSYLYSEPYGVEMRFADDPVTIQNSRLLLENFQMVANNGQPLSMQGYFDFSSMDNMYVSMRMRADNFQLIDAKETPRSEAYGKAFVNFFGAMTGPLSQLRMGGRLEVLGTTDMTYVMRESALSTDDQLDQLVTFTDLNDSTATNIVKPKPQGFQMDLSISIDEQAHIVCALNEAHTNFIDLIGGGDLTMHYDEANALTLNGRYTLNSGQMKYTLDMIPLRTFNIQEGSYIEFSGDPMNPTLSITATENMKANYSAGSNDRIVNFTAGVNMTGSLSKPTVEFIINAPDDTDAQNNLNTMSTEERGKVAVTLLASGMYIADGSNSNFAMNSALASFMQSKINDISGRALSSMGLDLTANMESTTDATGAMHTDYTFNFSKRLWNNRLTINMGGRVSTGSEATEDNGAYFDSFSMQYRLNKNETQYLRLYYEREAYDWLEGQVSEFGGGFLWKRKLQHFRDIFRWNTSSNTVLPPQQPADSTARRQ